MPQSKMCFDCFTTYGIQFVVRRAEEAWNWKGDAAPDTTKRNRVQRLGPVEGPCDHDGCTASAVERHHINGDTGDNRPQSIRLLCRKHHMEEDGRLAGLEELRVKAAEATRKPPRPCRICKRMDTVFWHGRCHACDMYLRRTGKERPEHLHRGPWAKHTPPPHTATGNAAGHNR